MKRVLLLIKGLGRGGAEQLLVSAAPYFDRSRFEYEVAYLLPWKDALANELGEAGMTVHCLDGGRGYGWMGRMRSLVHRRGIDVVHAHSPLPAIGARLALVGSERPALVYTEHNEWSRYSWPTRWANLITYPLNGHVFAVADGVRESVRYPRPLRMLPMPPLETLHHGLDHATLAACSDPNVVRRELGIPYETPVVGTVANFKPHKAHDLLLEAAWAVRQEVPDAVFILVGQGPTLEPTRRTAERLGLADAVILTGYRTDATRISSAFDVFALSSHNEGLPIALLEAMALGKPAVATRVGGIPETIEDGVHGLLVPSGDPSALAAGIVRLLKDAPLRRQMGEAARERAGCFDIHRAVRRMEEVYEELVG